MEEQRKRKAGRPDRYEEAVKPHLERIRKWAEQGATEAQIARELGVAYSTFRDYKKRYPELSAAIKEKDMRPLVEELRSALVKRALGYDYEESKAYTRTDPDSGKPVSYVERTKKHMPPDTTAIFGALNIYDDEYIRDRANYELKKLDLELRKAVAEANNFDLDLDLDAPEGRKRRKG